MRLPSLALFLLLESCSDSNSLVSVDQEYRQIVDGFNEKTGSRLIGAEDLANELDAGERVVLIDVREAEEQAVSTLPGALKTTPRAIAELDVGLLTDARVVTYCTVGYRSGFAAVELERRLNRPVYNLDGGIIEWFNRGGTVVAPSGEPAGRIHPYSDEWAKFVHPTDAIKNGK